MKSTVPFLKKAWKFIWEDDSIWSWLLNIALAFILIKFLILPGLGFAFGTSHPIVAVVSGSMEHDSNFDDWWAEQEKVYKPFGITKGDFEKFPMKNGFNKGDIIILFGVKPDDLKKGDIIVFSAQNSRVRPDPIIHRVVSINGDPATVQTKGDHNLGQIRSPELDETNIKWTQVIGRASLRIPLVGYVKIWFVDIISAIMGPFTR
ncbi:MAG TPA: signal peptidase I [Candidatus Nanoarchaeia archaeon]|nr:signal peptidase I [Candidatus Nanoarchaeia archaeon]